MPVSVDPGIGLVLTGRNNIFTVMLEDRELLCRLKGKRLDGEERAHNPLAPGDEVRVVSVDWSDGSGIIESRAERRNAFVRFNRKRNAPQTLAANVAAAVCIASAREPRFRARFVDRFLALCEDQAIDAVVVVTKSDLAPEEAELAACTYRSLGYEALAVSATSPTGLGPLRSRLADGRCVLIGQSGVGKSTLINRLLGREEQKVGHISSHYLRGRHTTNTARLIRSEGLEIIDTPGIRELDCRTIDIESLAWCFREFRPFVDSCEHDDCLHQEEPGCAVQAASRTAAVRPERYVSYRMLLAELYAMKDLPR